MVLETRSTCREARSLCNRRSLEASPLTANGRGVLWVILDERLDQEKVL